MNTYKYIAKFLAQIACRRIDLKALNAPRPPELLVARLLGDHFLCSRGNTYCSVASIN